VDWPYPAAELLERGLVELGLPRADGVCSPEGVYVRGIDSLVPLFNAYIRELELFNAVFDLVGATPGTEQGRSDLVVRHILDSLSPWREIAALIHAAECHGPALGAAHDTQSSCDAHGSHEALVSNGANLARLADAGSGAGFPGVPLAAVFPQNPVTLIERMTKRCAFLLNVKAILGLSNVTVLEGSVEDAPGSTFDIVAFRAFRPLDAAMTAALLRLLRHDGALAAWKARREKIDEELSGIAAMVGSSRVIPVTVPFLAHEERNLVMIRA
jgi:16S rRNA (guanine527-N7)-methyltransferase